MATLVIDPRLESRLIEQRRARGADHHDEVWEGVYVMTPLPNNEHQQIVLRLASILDEVVGEGGTGEVFPGVNLAGLANDWESDYRCPDVAVFLQGTAARNCDTHWRGGADLVVEITSPDDRTAEKIAFYEKIGVRELLIVDRQRWSLHLHCLQEGRLIEVGQATAAGEAIHSAVLPLRLRLLPGQPRPRIEVTHTVSGHQWLA
jgi:Uma2 family endonuclease